MSQSGSNSGGGGGGSGIMTINGDVGSVTGSTVSILASGLGGSFSLNASSATVLSMNPEDTSANILLGSGTAPATSQVSGGGNIIISPLSTPTGPTFTTAINNISLGSFSLGFLTTGSSNNSVGSDSLNALTTGSANNVLGHNSLSSLTTGVGNIAIGDTSLLLLGSGSNNICAGSSSGISYTSSESSNILLNSNGTVAESNVLRIGAGTGTSAKQLNKAFVSGINGNSVSNTLMVTINSATDQLGVQAVPSSSILPWTDEATSFAAAVNNGYFTTGTLTATLPASPTQGQVVAISVDTTDITIIQANTGQIIRLGNTVSSSAGTATNTARGDSIYLIYRSSSSTWFSTSTEGNWTLA